MCTTSVCPQISNLFVYVLKNTDVNKIVKVDWRVKQKVIFVKLSRKKTEEKQGGETLTMSTTNKKKVLLKVIILGDSVSNH